MWKRILLAAVIAGSAFAADDAKWKLVWADEFDGPEISGDWVFETGNGSNGWGNRELEYYLPENARIENGHLVITAKKEERDGFQYTSARMKTQGRKSWQYGRIEARIQLPSFKGSWPAFWMLGDNIGEVGWPKCGEIDIMEHINAESRIHGTAHWEGPDGKRAMYGGETQVPVTRFHVYAVEWDAEAIRWFVDGRKYHEMSIKDGVNGTSSFHEPFFILLNFAIGGEWPGFEVDDRAFPAEMRIDYVRVFERRP